MMKTLILLSGILPLWGCAASRPPLKTADNVDLQRFMGPWYVIASIPTGLEKKSYNAVETYRLDPNGTIDTVFTYNKGSSDGPLKTVTSRGFVVDKVNNSTWKIQFVWPLKMEYLITHVDEAYSQVVVSRNKRDYVWILSRTPSISEEDYERMVGLVKDQGYDVAKLRKTPQKSAS